MGWIFGEVAGSFVKYATSIDIRQHAKALLSQGPVLLSIWRPQFRDTADGPELRAVEVVADEVGSILVTPYAMF